MNLGVVITTDNEVYAQEFTSPLYKSVGKVVGGPIELVHPRGLIAPLNMIVNEEGLLIGLRYNHAGSMLYLTPAHGSPILGNIVIMQDGYVNGEPDIIGLTVETAARFIAEVAGLFNLKEIKKETKEND